MLPKKHQKNAEIYTYVVTVVSCSESAGATEIMDQCCYRSPFTNTYFSYPVPLTNNNYYDILLSYYLKIKIICKLQFIQLEKASASL
jgi:hypothetical protein